MKLTLGQTKARVAKVLNLNSTDSRVVDYINDAIERLLYAGKWVGTYGRYQVCVNASCLTWPREIETIEKWALDETPGKVRSGWYEFLGTGPGLADSDCGNGMDLIDRGEAVAFDDVVGTGKKLSVYCDVTEAVGARILLRFYDNNGQKVYSIDGGNHVEGEFVTLPAGGGYADTVSECMRGGLYGVVKPVTNRTVRLYEKTVADSSLKPLAYYEPTETVPVYRRSLIPGVRGSGDCGKSTVTVMGKLRFIPAVGDNDFLLIQHRDAIKLMAQAIRKEEQNEWGEAEAYEAKAKRLLQEQLGHWRGAGESQPVEMAGADLYGGGVENVI